MEALISKILTFLVELPGEFKITGIILLIWGLTKYVLTPLYNNIMDMYHTINKVDNIIKNVEKELLNLCEQSTHVKESLKTMKNLIESSDVIHQTLDDKLSNLETKSDVIKMDITESIKKSVEEKFKELDNKIDKLLESIKESEVSKIHELNKLEKELLHIKLKLEPILDILKGVGK